MSNHGLLPKIKLLCNQKNITITELSKILGFSNAAILKWENNIPSAEKISMVADYFNVSVDYLLDRSKIQSAADKAFSDPDIIMIYRLHSILSVKDKEKMMQMLMVQFSEYFEDLI